MNTPAASPRLLDRVLRTWWRFHYGIKTRLISLIILLVLMGMVGRALTLLPFLRENLQPQMAAQQFATAAYVAQDIDAKIHERQALLDRLARAVPASTLPRPEALRAWLDDHHRLYPLFSKGLLVLSPQGGVIAAMGASSRQLADYSGQEWFIRVRNQGLPTIGAPSRDALTQEPVIVMATPLRDAQGRSYGVLAGITALAAPGFLDLLQQSHLGQGGGFLLVSPRDQLFVAASDPDLVMKPTPPHGVNRLHDQAMAGYRGTGITVNAQGVEELSAMVSVPSAEWFLVARTPTAEVFQVVDRVQRFVIRNSVVIATTAILAMFFTLRWIFRPLSEAAHQVREMAEGKQPLRPLPVVRPDEVGELTAGFNSLLATLQEREAALARLASQDPLTGLPNRLAFLERTEQSLALARRHQAQLALLFIDLDCFKPVNDEHGHDAGDQLLRQVAERLRLAVRQADVVGRLGGDEFVVLLTDLDGPESATRIAAKCVDVLAAPFQIDGFSLSIGASIGIALFPHHGSSAESLLVHADAAMYDAKHGGRNTYRLASSPSS